MRHGERGFTVNQTLSRKSREHTPAKGVLGDLLPVLPRVIREHREAKSALPLRLGVAGTGATAGLAQDRQHIFDKTHLTLGHRHFRLRLERGGQAIVLPDKHIARMIPGHHPFRIR